jgi:FMN phosphatase YigB (HAD superfamily)
MRCMHTGDRTTARLLVTDLDNTLWDWFKAWHYSFAAMLDRLSERSGIAKPQLEAEIREVHQRRNTTEYTVLLGELPSLRRLHPAGTDILAEYDDVLHVLNSERKRHTRLYPEVLETLRLVKATGVPIVAYTESLAYWTEWRMIRLGLDGLIDILYSSPDHDFPEHVTPADLRTLPPETYGLKMTKHRWVPAGVVKPDDTVLRSIIADLGVPADRTVYIGDSLTKDVAMAQSLGVLAVHATYGVSDSRPEYDLLRRVSHWPRAAIEAERKAAAGAVVVPDYSVLTFGQLLDFFDFRPQVASK